MSIALHHHVDLGVDVDSRLIKQYSSSFESHAQILLDVQGHDADHGEFSSLLLPKVHSPTEHSCSTQSLFIKRIMRLGRNVVFYQL